MHDRSGNIIVPLRVVGEQTIVDDPHKSQERFTDHRISRINPRRKEERGDRDDIYSRAYIRNVGDDRTQQRTAPDISIDRKKDGIIFPIWRLIRRLYPRSILDRLHYPGECFLFFFFSPRNNSLHSERRRSSTTSYLTLSRSNYNNATSARPPLGPRR